MFEKLTVTKAIKENVRKYRNKEFSIPVVYCKFGDNGIMYWGREGEFTTFENVISVVYNGVIAAGKVYAQKQATGILAESYFIRLKQHKASHNVNLYLATVLEKVLYPKYSRDYLATWDNKVENDIIVLPTKNNKIDFDFIEEFMAELEERSVAELEAWLRAAGLENYELTKEERSAIENFDSTPTISATLKEHISIKKIIGINSDALTDGDCYDYITRTSMNQGILRSTGVVKNANLNPKNTWSLGLLQMDFFMRRRPWYAGQFVRILEPKNILNENQMLWFTAILNKQKQSLQSVLVRDVNEKLRNTIIRLPAKSGQPDYSKMATIISAVKKLVIKDVAEYANKRIRGAQQVIAK
ncbi:restriction endonuclease subunit S [Segatella buccae]|uniref:restriction endonuclease subunit S n=1 Tax=Segatella buccae TaxID=28126 RepID=UPI003FA25EDE